MELRSTASVVSSIADVIAPHLGEYMAKAAVEGHRARLGLSPDLLAAGDVESLLHKVSLGLIIFVGKEKTADLIARARGTIAELPTR